MVFLERLKGSICVLEKSPQQSGQEVLRRSALKTKGTGVWTLGGGGEEAGFVHMWELRLWGRGDSVDGVCEENKAS